MCIGGAPRIKCEIVSLRLLYKRIAQRIYAAAVAVAVGPNTTDE